MILSQPSSQCALGGLAFDGGKFDLGQNSDINVTPFVDVMLVLLIIFMVTAPLLTAGVPLELPESKGQQLQTNKEPLTISVAGQSVTAGS